MDLLRWTQGKGYREVGREGREGSKEGGREGSKEGEGWMERRREGMEGGRAGIISCDGNY